jgi:hypothetical protein
MLVGILAAVVGLFVWGKRARERRADLEARVERLEDRSP